MNPPPAKKATITSTINHPASGVAPTAAGATDQLGNKDLGAKLLRLHLDVDAPGTLRPEDEIPDVLFLRERRVERPHLICGDVLRIMGGKRDRGISYRRPVTCGSWNDS